MNSTLRTAVLAATVTALLPAGAALAHGGHDGKEHGKAKPKKSHCHKGKGYEVQGILAAGSSLAQVSGADTKRRGDDRFSGKLVVEVKQGNRRGRRDKGLSSYVIEGVRVNGAASGESALPVIGSRVLLVGKQLPAACLPAEPADPTDPTDPTTPDYPTDPTTPDYPTDEPTATATSYGDDHPRHEHPKGKHPKGDDYPAKYPGGSDDSSDEPKGEDCPDATSPEEPEPTDYPAYPSADDQLDEAEVNAVTDVRIKLVRFAAPR